jgi:hypothetical protein
LTAAGLAAVGALVPWGTATAAPSQLLLVGWDGAERTVVQDLLQANALPNLAGLGPLVPLTVTTPHGESMQTKPGWTKVHTGLGANTTGVLNNETWRSVPASATLSARWAARRAKQAWVVAKRHTMERDPTRETAEGPLAGAARLATVRYEMLKATPGTLTMALSPWLLQWRDDMWFAFWHSHEPDVTGHTYGWTSDAYRRALMQLDTLLGVLRTAAGGAAIVVTTDHGFGCPDDFHHPCAPNGWAVSNLDIPSWVATLTDLGRWLQDP